MDIRKIRGVSFHEDGFWYSKVKGVISYTKDGHNQISSSENHSFWFQHRLYVIEKVIRKINVNELLDIGGGNGQICKSLQDKDIDVTLLEPSVSAVRNAKANGVRNIINASFIELEIPEATIPTIGLFDVLEHIEDDVLFLEKIFKVLENNGCLLITVPALQSLYSEFDNEVGHFRRYTLNDLENKLRSVGFTTIYKTYLFLPLPFLMWPLRKLYKFIEKPKKRRKFGHISKYNFFGKVVNLYLGLERISVNKSIRIPFGSSCMIVACKTNKV